MSEKTEQPTPKRLRKAHEEGDSGASSVLSQSLAFLTATALSAGALAYLSAIAGDDLRRAIAVAGQRAPSPTFDTAWLVKRVVEVSVPLFLCVGATALIATFAQTGATIAPKKIIPKWERLNPFAGFLNLFSSQRLFAVARAIVASGAVALIGYRTIRAHAGDFALLAGAPQHLPAVIKSVALELTKACAIVFAAIGFVDLAVTKRAWYARLRMSKDEIKREHKESEGDPETKAQRERARREMLAAATILNVRKASVVVVNPTHLACALEYTAGDDDAAPVVVASGEGDLAKRIVEAARAYGIPVIRDVPLARALIELEVGTAIPESLYEAVAEILREAFDEAEQAAR